MTGAHRTQRLHVEPCEPRHLLATLVSVADTGSGIAVADDATGTGYILYSQEDVQVRFDDVNLDNADHFIAVRFAKDTWQYNNDTAWVEFVTAESDLLVANVDFDADVVKGFEGTVFEKTVKPIGDVPMGYLEGDLHFLPNQWNGQPDLGEIEVTGSYFAQPIRIEIGAVNSGVAVADDAAGTGYLMFSAEKVHTRFRGALPAGNADHLVAVRPRGEFWQYNNDQTWVSFKQAITDRLIAQIDFAADTIEPIIETDRARYVDGLTTGFVQGDLEFTADVWAGDSDEGEFTVSGTYIQLWNESVMPTSGDNLHEIAQAMLNHESATRRIPAHAIYSDDNQPVLSWRVSILPYLGYSELYDEFELHEPWNSPQNLKLLDRMPRVFASSNVLANPISLGLPRFPTQTVYQVMTGADTAFPIARRGVTLGHILDGLSNTALIVEVESGHAVPWTKPQDVAFDPASPLSGIANSLAEDFHVALANAEVLSLPQAVDAELFTNLVLRNDGQFVDLLSVAPPLEPDESLLRLAKATLNHESATRRFPLHAIYAEVGGQPLLSWRVAILPYLGQENLYREFHLNEPWDSPHNIQLVPKMPRVFAHKSVSGHQTSFLAFAGDDTVLRTPDPDGNYRGITVGQISDGTENTIMFAEADPDRAAEWTKPQDIAYDPANSLDGVGHLGTSEFHVALADGSVGTVSNSVADDVFHRLVTRNDGVPVDVGVVDPFRSAENNLRRLVIAAMNHELATRQLPAHAIYSAGGQPLLSWRVTLLPYLGHHHLYAQFHLNEPWDSPHNRSLLPMMPRAFAHPQVAGFNTNYLAITGEGTAFPIASDGIDLRDVSDGLSKTALFVEANTADAVEWTRPQDILFDAGNPLDGLTNIIEAGFHVGLADGSGALLSRNIEPAEFARLALISDESTTAVPVFSASVSVAQLVDPHEIRRRPVENLPVRPVEQVFSEFVRELVRL